MENRTPGATSSHGGDATTDAPLWSPGPRRIEKSRMAAFMRFLGEGDDAPADFDALYAYSINEPEGFWQAIWRFCGVKGEMGAPPFLIDGDKLPRAGSASSTRRARFFPNARLNFAENLLRRNDDTAALIFRGEDKVRRTMTWSELHGCVSRLQQVFMSWEINPGDRICAIMPNMPETVAAQLAASSIGAVWSSCSPDFGVGAALDRFGQIEPKVLVACGGYYYNGKYFDIGDKLADIAAGLPSVRHVIVAPYGGIDCDKARPLPSIGKAVFWNDILDGFEPGTPQFTRLPFDHPLYILFSSGTTGAPKCIVHSQGGTLLQHLKEHQLHCDLRPGDRLFYFTTCGWMMWNWLATGLASEATLLLYDGSPFYPDGNALFDFADEENMTVFGVSAKFIDAVRKAGLRPRDTHDLGSLRLMTSTGSPLAAESFDFVYQNIKPDIHLASISGGTDIVSCFVLGNPMLPVWRGEIQGPGLGMAVDVFDAGGNPTCTEKGELVCVKPFPSMPISFWNDPDGEKYHAAYFGRFENVWCHGDFAEWTPHNGMIIHGRSDATLNPGGVRIGTAEIYAQVEQLDEINESIAIGQNFEDDVRIVLFVVLADGYLLDDELRDRIRRQIRSGASPRHVPAKIIAVTDIPRTKSGKITELAVRDIVHGVEVGNREALANPQALELFRDIKELKT